MSSYRQQFSLGLSRMSRTIRDKMSIHDEENLTPSKLISARPITSALASFFGTSQLVTVHGSDKSACGNDT